MPIAFDVSFSPEKTAIERRLLSLASPLYPFRTAQIEDTAVTRSPEYLAWLDHKGPQILYVHGSHDVRSTAEQIFFHLHEMTEDLTNDQVAILYFSFDRWDVRCDSVRDMASTFLAQLSCQYPRHRASNAVRFLASRLETERSWTEADLMFWLNQIWSHAELTSTICVINHFDECVKGSRNAFLQKFIRLTQGSEKRHRMVVTSHLPGSLLTELSGTPHSVLELSSYEEAEASPTDLPPELLLQESQIQQQRLEIAGFDHLVRHILWCQAKTRADWPNDVSLINLFGPLVPATVDQDDTTLTLLLDRLLKRIRDQTTLSRLLTWLLYAVRPLTVQELSIALDPASEINHGGRSVASTDAVDSLTQKLETWLAGIVTIDHNEIKFVHPRLRRIMMSAHEDTAENRQYLWAQVAKTAHYDITSMCLDYLKQPSVQKTVEESQDTAGATSVADRSSLRLYALQAWTHHFSLVPDDKQPELVHGLELEDISRNLARGSWSLSNRATRESTAPKSLFPICAGLGLLLHFRPLDVEDAVRGLVEAASKGRETAVQALLEDASRGRLATKRGSPVEFSTEALLEALVAAGASGNERLIDILTEHIASLPGEEDPITWPAKLIHRIAWLGYAGSMERLLQLGATVQPENPFACPMEPIYQAVRNLHGEMVRLLLEHGANVNFRADADFSLLHLAAINNGPGVAKILLEQGKAELEAHGPVGSETALYFAARYGNYGVVQELLKAGADPNMGIPKGEIPEDDRKWSPLTVAAMYGFLQCVTLLLEAKANPDVCSPGAQGTPLGHAAVGGGIETCRLLLEQGADPNSPLINPPLLCQVINNSSAMEASRLNVLRLLLEHGANANAKDAEELTPLIYASLQDNGTVFAEALLDHGADIDLGARNGASALYYAAEGGKAAMVELLLKRKANTNQITNFGNTPLYPAVDNARIVQMMLESGANPDLGSGAILTPLMQAAYNDRDESLERLLDHNATIDLTYAKGEDDTYSGWTALSCAVQGGAARCVKILAERGANLRCHGAKLSPLMIQASKREDIIQVLLEFPTRIDINYRYADHLGRSALHDDDVPIGSFTRLINAGADPNLFDSEGLTPLTIAAYNGRAAKVAYALRFGGDPNTGSPRYGAALHMACWGLSEEVVKLLLDKGADVNAVFEDMGTPLLMLAHPWVAPQDEENVRKQEAIARLLTEHNADLNKFGGKYGYALNRVAMMQRESFVRLFLELGARADVKDTHGRSPVHLAAHGGIGNLRAILEDGGDPEALDGMQRTPVHYAAFGARAQALDFLLSSLGSKYVDVPDIDGWTPLCWAAFCVRDGMEITESCDQLKTIRVLLERGADRFIVAAGPLRSWTPIKIARYCGASDVVIELLRAGIDGQDPVTPETEDYTSRKARDGEGACDVCNSVSPAQFHFAPQRGEGGGGPHYLFFGGEHADWEFQPYWGVRHQCIVCVNYDLCFKCFASAAIIHPGHEFRDIGHEFDEEEQAANKQDGDEDSASDTSTSDEASDDD